MADCEKCGLWDTCLTPNIQPDVTFNSEEEYADIMFIGEAPGKYEDEQGVPFVGRSGQTLRDVVEAAGLSHLNLVYTNIVHCRPPNNKTPSAKQLKACYGRLKEEVEYYQPQLIILLGNSPLKAVLGESGITSWRGVFVDRGEYAIMPTLHPAYILRNLSLYDLWTSDFDKAYDYIVGEEEVQDVSEAYEMSIVEDEEACLEMINVMYDERVCSWDTEVNGLRYGDLLVCMSFACKEAKKAWCVLLEDENVVKQVRKLLEDKFVRKIGHNVKFDWLAIKSNWRIEVQGIVGDSMLLSSTLDPAKGRHGLKNLAGRYLSMYDYNAGFNEARANNKTADPHRGGDLRLMNIDTLAEYACLDAIATVEIHALLYEELDEPLQILYDELIIEASDMLAVMESNGTLLDDNMVDEYITIYQAKKDELLDTLKAHPVVKKYVKERKKKEPKFKEFNPNSSYHMRDILFGKRYFRLPSTGYKTDTGKESTKWDHIKIYVHEEPWLADYRYFKLMSKMLSTYLIPPRDVWKDRDGRVRSDYKINGAETGRLSSSSPNLQNIPTPEKEPGTLCESHPIKNIFTHTWDMKPDPRGGGLIYNKSTGEIIEPIFEPRSAGCILAVDYSGMELRTMASVSDCIGMKEAFASGVDVHSYVTELLYGINKADFTPEEWKPKRYRAKWVNWTLLFGGSAYTLYRLYGIEKAEANELIDKYYGAFPEVLEYKEETLAFARSTGYVESKFGRRRYMPYINDPNDGLRRRDERAAINMPIQSAASDILICSLIILRDQLRDYEFKSLMVNTVHDSVMFDVYPGELDDLAWLCTEVMENITTYGKDYFPGLNFDWFTVPLKVDLEVGSHYGSVSHYELEV